MRLSIIIISLLILSSCDIPNDKLQEGKFHHNSIESDTFSLDSFQLESNLLKFPTDIEGDYTLSYYHNYFVISKGDFTREEQARSDFPKRGFTIENSILQIYARTNASLFFNSLNPADFKIGGEWGDLFIIDLKCKDLSVSGYSTKLCLKDVQCLNNIYIANVRTDNFVIAHSKIKSLTADISDVSYAVFNNIQIENDCRIKVGKFTKLISLKSQNKLLITTNQLNDVKPQIVVNNIDINLLDFDEQLFEVIVDKNQGFVSSYKLYKQLIELYSINPVKRQMYEIELYNLINNHEHNYITNWLQKNWNNYGFDKFLIFRNSLIFMFITYLINLSIYKKMINEVYEITELKKAEMRVDNLNIKIWKKKIYRLTYCMIFTFYVFWGLKLDVEKLKYKYIMISCWIILQYLIGIICLAHIANIIITK